MNPTLACWDCVKAASPYAHVFLVVSAVVLVILGAAALYRAVREAR